jgi:HSP20 family protein
VANLIRSRAGSPFALAARPPGMSNFTPQLEQAPRMYVDIEETDDAYLLTADVPGADREKITVIVDGDTVSIRALMEKDNVVSNRRMLAIERIQGEQVRTFTLPDEIDEARADARVIAGVLVLRLPKKPEPGSRSAMTPRASWRALRLPPQPRPALPPRPST